MGFLSPLFLLGAVALAAPILVHLVRRTRARRIEFPALMFVRQIPQRSIRRQKLHNLLLLLLRSLGLLLIVLAFTRPFFTSGSAADAAAQQQRESVILLDTSLSMTYKNRFQAAQKQASAIIDSARSDERLALITFNQGYEIVSRLDADRGKVKTALDAVRPGSGGTDYLQALKGAEDLLKQEGTAGGFKRIFLISDLQASGWREKNSSLLRLPEELGLALVDVATDESANVAVTNIEARGMVYSVKYPYILTARIVNFSEVARPSVEITFQINEQTVEKRDIKLDAQGSATLEFTNFNLAEGANRCAISVNADEFRSDDVFYFTVTRNKPVDALVIDTSGRTASESLYLVQALSTGEGLPFTVSVKSSGSIDPSQVGEYGLIILNDVGSMSKQLTDALRNYLQEGGSLIAGVGPHTDAEAFNEAFKDYAPAMLTSVIKRGRQEPVAIGDVQLNHPIFQIFKDGGQLSPLKVFGYYKGVPSQDSAVIARFEDGNPAVLEAGVGSRGKFLLYTSTFDATWSDLPLTRLYLPFVQQMARHLIERQQASAHLLGETFAAKSYSAASGGATEFPAIDTPSGERLTEKVVSSRGELLVTAREPGFYRLRYTPSPDYVAANTDRAESDFSKLNIEDFTNALRNGGAAAAASPTLITEPPKLSAEEAESRQRVWWPLLIAALLLFVAEAILARRTKMSRMIG